MPGAKSVAQSVTHTTLLVRPADVNTNETLFGGRLLEIMDMTAAVCARRHSGTRVTTGRLDQVVFTRPIPIGAVVSVTARMHRAFSHSMEVGVTVSCEDTYTGTSERAASALFIVVGTNESGRPAAVPELRPETEQEVERWSQAGERKNRREGTQ